MRMRFKQRLSALLAQIGLQPTPPPPITAYYPGGRPKFRSRSKRKRKRSPARIHSLYVRLHPARVLHTRHLWPPQERSRRPEWSSAVPGEWSSERWGA